ncbi:MAG: hypothetical protein ACKVZH_04630 [Blastocatellia bacterium]
MKKYQLVLCFVTLSLMAGAFASLFNTHQPIQPAKAAEILRLNIPAVVHGFKTTDQLPNGDLYLLPQPMQMAISDAPEGTRIFPVSRATFGAEADTFGALQTTSPQGISLETAHAKATALTCAESIWDGNLVIAGNNGAQGDKVRLFLRYPDGRPGPELGLFTQSKKDGKYGVEVTQLHKDLMLFVNDRYARGPATPEKGFIPYTALAGESGERTDLLTLAWPMHGFSVLQGCFQVGVEIQRGDNSGKTSVVVTDLVVNRNAVPGDENLKGVGLLKNVLGGFPTGFPCKAECPFPDANPRNPNVPNTGGTGGGECNTICYRSPQYFKLNLKSLPRGTVFIGGVNFNQPVSTTDKQTLGLALRGGFTPLQQFNQEYVTAQLNMLNAGGSGSSKVYYALEGALTCYNLNFDAITLSTGTVLTTDSQLKDLYREARLCINTNNLQDIVALTRIFDLLNGNNPMNICHNQ